MEVLTTYDELVRKIESVQLRRDQEKDALQAEFTEFKESLKPVNIIRGFFQELKSSDVKADILKGAMGLATGFLTNKLLLGRLGGPLKTAMSAVIPGLFTSLAVKTPDTLKEKGLSMLYNFLQSIKIKTKAEKQYEAADGSL